MTETQAPPTRASTVRGGGVFVSHGWLDSLFLRELAPFVLVLGGLTGLALGFDWALHLLNAAWIGRWLGIPGVLLIVASSAYSLRKRQLITTGRPATLLRWHEGSAWAGSLMILVHAGGHFNALLGWLAVLAMMVNIVSGLTGRYLLKRSRTRLDATRKKLRSQGLSAEALAEQTWWDSLTVDIVKNWRAVHVPITLAFAGLAIAHIVAASLYWGWK